MSSKQAERVVLYWHRTDLRLHDSPALRFALDELKPKHLYPVWCWDPHYVFNQRVGPNRWQFLLDSMSALSRSYTELNDKSRLFVVRAPPLHAIPALIHDWGITDLVFETDDGEPYVVERDELVSAAARDAGVDVHAKHGHTLFPLDEIKRRAGKAAAIPNSYGSFVKLLEKGKPPAPLERPGAIPDPGATDLQADDARWAKAKQGLKAYYDHSAAKDDSGHTGESAPAGEDLNRAWRPRSDESYASGLAGPNGDFGVPTIDELGIDKPTSKLRGGEDVGLSNLEQYLEDKDAVTQFRKPKTSPAQFDPASTTMLSAHMKFGTVSCRLFWHRVNELNKAAKQGHSSPPESLVGQLYWREFFHAQQATTPHFKHVRGNRQCKFVNWKLQTRYRPEDAGKLEAVPLPSEQQQAAFEKDEPEAWAHLVAWREGKTGFPWIDALMRQLHRDGWIHHLARHSLACFLTRGQLYISWERGAEVFDTYLIDWDPSLNTGNWLWLSASAFFSQYFRAYGIKFGQKYDRPGKLIREFVPELRDLPDKYIYEPWTAPKEVLRKAGVELGKDYPRPIVDDKEAKNEAMAGMKAAYAANMHGDDQAVLDGTAADLIEKQLGGGKKRKAKDEAEDEASDEDVESDEEADPEESKPKKGRGRGGGGGGGGGGSKRSRTSSGGKQSKLNFS